MTTRLRIGTRGSPLALAQARAVAARLQAPGTAVEIVPIRTEGDRLIEARLAAVGGKGLFVREIEQALLAGTVDCAVHSLKDLPAELPAGLVLTAFPPREDPGDVLVTRTDGGLDALFAGAVVGTSSPRRRALVLALRPDLVVEPIRGNVDTRLRKLEGGGFDGVILAAAGLRRLELTPRHACRLDPAVFVPAVGQGIVAIETCERDGRVRELLRRLDHATTHACALAERAYLARLGASCNSPMAGHARPTEGRLEMTGVVASEDGKQLLRAGDAGPATEAEALGRRLADALLARGAASVAALRP